MLGPLAPMLEESVEQVRVREQMHSKTSPTPEIVRPD